MEQSSFTNACKNMQLFIHCYIVYPPEFPAGKSLFDGYFESSSYETTYYCSCFGDAPSKCEPSISEWRYPIDKTDVLIQPGVPAPNNTAKSRRRRSPSDPQPSDSSYDFSYNSQAYKFANADNATGDWNFTWPTSTGINQSQANETCYTRLWRDAPYRQACSTSLSQTDVDSPCEELR